MKRSLLSNFFLFLFFLASLSAVAQIKGGNSTLATLDSTKLPIVFINTNYQTIADEPKIEAGMAIIDNGYNVMNRVTDTNFKYYGAIGIEQRGSISQQWWWTQKSYAVETHDLSGNDSDAVILGMPKENDWVLYGPFTETTLMHNVLSYKLASQMGYWAPRTKYCEMMIKTGLTWKYNGIYVMTEKIKRGKNRVDISKLDIDDNAGDSLSGGYIIAVDKNINANDSGWFSKHAQNPNVFLTYKYPKQEDITSQQKTYIKAYVDSFENSLSSTNFANPVSGFRKFIEPTTFMDFFFLQELSKNIDAYKRSSYLYKDKFSDGGKLNANPHWDYNSAWEIKLGGCEPFAADTGWTYPLTCWVNASYPVPFWWKRLLQDTTYTRDMKCRWMQMRSTVLSNANIFHIMDSLTGYISTASTRHYSQFSMTQNFQTEVTALKTWIGKRLTWMDAHMPGNCWNTGVGNEAALENSISVYPNPTSGIFNLMSGTYSIYQIEVQDIFGRTVQRISSDQKITSVDISSQPQGIYFLKCYSEAGDVSLKTVKI